MLQSQALIRKLTGCKGCGRKVDSGNLRPPVSPVSPLRRATAGCPETSLQEAFGSVVARMSSQGPQEGFQVREGFLEEVEF